MKCDFCFCETATDSANGLGDCPHFLCEQCKAGCPRDKGCPLCLTVKPSSKIEVESCGRDGFPSRSPTECIRDIPIDGVSPTRVRQTVAEAIEESTLAKIDEAPPRRIEETDLTESNEPQHGKGDLPPDGFSFYRCVAKEIWDSDSHFKKLWEKVMKQIHSEWSYYSVYITDSAGNTFHSAQEYAEKSETFQSWKDRMTEIQVICNMFHLKIVVVTTSDRGTKEIGFCPKNKSHEKEIRLKDSKESDLMLESLDSGTLGAVPKLSKVRITGDGNCLYRAISMAITGNEKYHIIVRRLIMTYIRKNWEELKPFAFDRSGNPYKSIDSYIMHNSSSGDFGGSLEICAASKALNVGITLHSEPDIVQFDVENPDLQEPIHLLHQGSRQGGHFNLLQHQGSVAVASNSILRRACSRMNYSESWSSGDVTVQHRSPKREEQSKKRKGSEEAPNKKRRSAESACAVLSLSHPHESTSIALVSEAPTHPEQQGSAHEKTARKQRQDELHNHLILRNLFHCLIFYLILSYLFCRGFL